MQNTLQTPKKDNIGFYYDTLPDGCRLATIKDFHVHGKKKIGMPYIVQWNDEIRYSYREVNDSLTGEKIYPFIKAQKVFVFNGH